MRQLDNSGKQSFKKAHLASGLFFFLVMFLFLQQILVLPGRLRITGAVNNALHVPFFFLITVLIWWLLQLLTTFSFRKSVYACLFICTILALASEFLQTFTARDASLWDIGFDMTGTASALLLLLAGEYRRAVDKNFFPVLVLVLSGLLFLSGFSQVAYIAWMNYERQEISPRLIDVNGPERLLSYSLVGNWEMISGQVTEGEREPGKMLKITLQRNEPFPGIKIEDPLTDWTPYTELVMETMLEDDRAIPITVRVENSLNRGQESKMEALIEPGHRRLKLPVSSLIPDDQGDLALVHTLLIFSGMSDADRAFFLADLRLE